MEKKNYIALTALESHWAEPDNTLFLGEWCKLAHRKEVWSKYCSKTIAHNWNGDAKQVGEAVDYCDKIAKQLIKSLNVLLEKHFSLNFPERFYEKLLAPWAFFFTATLYDRYLSIKQVNNSERHIFLTLNTQTPLFPAHDFLCWAGRAATSDYYNLFLFSEIITLLKLPEEERLCCNESIVDTPRILPKKTLKKRCLLAAAYFFNKVLGRPYYVVGGVTKNKFVNFFTSSFGSILQDNIWEHKHTPPPCIDTTIRQTELKLKNEDEFSSLLAKLALRHLPWGFLEAMPSYVEQAKKHPASKACCLVSSTGHWGSILWLYIVAVSGAPYGIVEHGGYKNTVEPSQTKSLEQFISERYFDSGVGSHPLPNPELYFENLTLSSDASTVLFVSSFFQRYPAKGGYLRGADSAWMYYARQIDFFEQVNPEFHLQYRPFLVNNGYEDFEKIVNSHPNITLQSTSMPYKDAVAAAKLIIFDNCWLSLAIIQVLTLRKPCILIYYADLCGVSKQMQRVMQCMADAKILYFNAKDAAEHLNSVYHDIDSWWQTEKVQKALDLFINNFACSVDNWPAKWAQSLKLFAKEFNKNK